MDYTKTKNESFDNLGGINSKQSLYKNEITEFRDISNMNFVIPNALTKRPGTINYLEASVQGQITGDIEFDRLSGQSFLIVTANTNAYTVTNSFSAFKTGLRNNALFSLVVFVDRLFGANGQDFFKYDGTNSTNYSLPYGATGWGITAIVGGGLSGTFNASYGYLNDRGYLGPVTQGLSISLNGTTFGTIGYYGLTTPAGYGISAIQLYRSSNTSFDLVGTTFTPASATTVSDPGFQLTPFVANNDIQFTSIPRYLEIFNNELMMSGFSNMPSTIAWSRIGEPEGVQADYTAEVRTNDGDRIYGQKSYNGNCIIGKERSCHRLSGNDPSNFSLQEISDQYGCISHRSMVVFNNLLWFLDPKGVVQYDGANIGIISNPIEPVFLRMNLAAARDNACALHNRAQNEVWFSIPVDGATLNNTIVVHDYLVNAWTHYDGVNAAHLFLAKRNLALKTPFFGGYSGNILYFGASLTNDNGRAITCMFDSRFIAERGQTTENMYRRFYLNLNPVLGLTQAITLNFRTNYGSTVQLSRTMYQAPFQSRIDFGLPARSIQAEMIHTSASLPLTVFGFAFESRYQRGV